MNKDHTSHVQFTELLNFCGLRAPLYIMETNTPINGIKLSQFTLFYKH